MRLLLNTISATGLSSTGLAVLALLGALVLDGCHGAQALEATRRVPGRAASEMTVTAPALTERTIATPPLPAVRAVGVAVRHRAVVHRIHGATSPTDERAVAFTTGGRLVETHLVVGQQLDAGSVVARLDPAPFDNAVAGARAEVKRISAQSAQAKRDQERTQRLRDQGALSAVGAEQAGTGSEALSAAVKTAQAQLTEARRQRDEATLVAPFDAVVVAVLAEPGEVVPPGAPIAMLRRANIVQVSAMLTASQRTLVGEGTALRVHFPLMGHPPCPAIITEAADTSASVAGLFPIKAQLDPACLAGEIPSGGGLAVEIELAQTTVAELAVPLRAVFNPSGDEPWVWKLGEVGGQLRAERAPVRLGEISESWVYLRSGLAEGDRIVDGFVAHLLPGDAVEVLP